jgi:hypothetical protein
MTLSFAGNLPQMGLRAAPFTALVIGRLYIADALEVYELDLIRKPPRKSQRPRFAAGWPMILCLD